MKTTKKEWSWILYDWANSAFAIVMLTAILPLFFKDMTSYLGIADSDSTAFWGYANSIGTFLIAILAPFLGTIADYQGFKKRFFIFFFSLGVFFTGIMATVPMGQWKIVIVFYILSLIGFSGANVFYDSFLTDVTDDKRMDKISSMGYAYGYIGSTIPFIIGIAIVFFSRNLGISTTFAYRLSFVITALWWGLFTIPMLKNVKQVYYIERENNSIKNSFKRLMSTLKNIKEYKAIFIFLLAYFFYNDGVGTIIRMASVFGRDVGVAPMDLLVILLVTQFVAFPFALLYGKLSSIYSGKTMILVAVSIYIFICIYAYQIDSTLDFWILAMLVASSQGGIQALSRSYFGKLIPKNNSSEFFGIYNIFGRFSSILGPTLVGIIAQVTGNTRYGVFSVVIFFLIGAFLLLKVPNQVKLKAVNQ
ncbi:MFS transporter [Caloranaerobacter ferrireducens]|uniref:MFS transporter n=1 Tax=Caloranaerobacter ferrireducens TaxID=1323370 RepID=UPI00084D311B|nr:MFS transporter [Caloranaerobacter ferrireducens]